MIIIITFSFQNRKEKSFHVKQRKKKEKIVFSGENTENFID
jgi:hypothetical protein